MKAIIILNYASEDDIGKKTSIHLRSDENEWVEEVVIKPMPKRVAEISYDFAYGWSKTFDQFIESQTKIEWMTKGWNACLEEIENG